MSKTLNRATQPKLRFPEFLKSGGWKIDTLETLAVFRRGSFPQPYGELKWYDEENGMPFVQVFDVDDNLRLKSKTKNKISKLAAEMSVFIPKGTVIVTIQGSIGRVAITQYDAYIDRTLLLFEKYLKPIDKVFFTYVLEILFAIEKQKAPGGVIKTITKEVLSKFKVPVPDVIEQKKIAECLFSLDELIAAQADKINALNDYKNGLLQQLFPQAGETAPRLRFHEFQKSGAWDSSTLGEVSSYENGKAHEQGISDEGRYVVANSKFISTDGAVKKFANTALCLANKNDILMVLSDLPNGRAIAKCYYVENDDNITVNQRICKIVAKKVDSRFLFYTLNRNPYFLGFDDGVKQTNLSKEEVLSCPVSLPTDKDEQQKISGLLLSIDCLIDNETKKKESIESHKKGLLQQLFPSLTEESDA
jgi:type I restriction enzyme S subunit